MIVCLIIGASASLRGKENFASFASAKGALRNLTQSIAPDVLLDPDAIADAYWKLHHQHRSAWTLELDLRPWSEAF
jgi:hypothetical protein